MDQSAKIAEILFFFNCKVEKLGFACFKKNTVKKKPTYDFILEFPLPLAWYFLDKTRELYCAKSENKHDVWKFQVFHLTTDVSVVMEKQVRFGIFPVADQSHFPAVAQFALCTSYGKALGGIFPY